MEKFEFTAKKSERVSKAIISEVANVSFAQTQKLFRNKDVLLNGKRLSSDCNCNVGDKIVFFANINSKLTLQSVYEDENILIVFKPHKMEVTKKDKSKNSSVTVEDITGFTACHRLDRNTEGLVVLAKNSRVKNEMLNAFKNRNVSKFYRALAFGRFERESEVLKAYLTKDEKNSIVKVNRQSGDEIITKYTVISQLEDYALLDVELITGKTHQIRAHLDFIGHSIVGDEKYCSKQNRKMSEFYFKEFNGYALTCCKLVFNFKKGGLLSYLNGKEVTCQPTWKI